MFHLSKLKLQWVWVIFVLRECVKHTAFLFFRTYGQNIIKTLSNAIILYIIISTAQILFRIKSKSKCQIILESLVHMERKLDLMRRLRIFSSPKCVGKFEVLHEWFSEMVPYCKLIMIAQSDLHQSTFLCWENSRDLVPVLTVGLLKWS